MNHKVKIIAESKKNLKKLKEQENSKNQINEIPTQIITKFISMEGLELKNEESLTNELTLPTEITILDLNKLLNEKLNNKEFQIYQFYINDIEIKNNIKETIKKIENFSSENIYKIVYSNEDNIEEDEEDEKDETDEEDEEKEEIEKYDGASGKSCSIF